MRPPRSPVRRPSVRRAAIAAALLLLLSSSACSSQDRATSPGELRGLASGAPAKKAREETESHLRAVAGEYDRRTPLTLGLVAVDDRCAGGSEKEWLSPSEDDRYRIRCTLRLTAWFGADPDRIGDTLDAVFTAGDRASPAGAPAVSVPFGHDDYRGRLVDYYRGRGPNPTGPGAPEPTQVSDPSQTLSWDTARSTARTLVEEPQECGDVIPPVSRCLREPEGARVAGLRNRYGTVFRLDLTPSAYYEVLKGQGAG
ncbi:hypothetical protein [Streptomyces sp. NPDC059166]|uniref:hypothetical protein n=1 Tax=Streptomyces sp. NPDC059166 TaxID=3346752 RepID=UPI0036AAE97F